MSVEAMSWAFAVPLPPCPKSVLISLANRADEDGVCWPGLDDLELRTGWKRRAIQGALRYLVQVKLLTVTDRFSPIGRQQSNLYRLAIGQQPTPISCGEGAPDAPPRVHQMHGEGAPDAPPRVHQMHGEGAPDAPPRVHQMHGEGAPDAPLESSSESSDESSGGREGACAPALPPLCVVPGKNLSRTEKKRIRGSPFPEDWVVEAWMRDLCGGFGFNADAEFAHFKSHHRSIGSIMLSWPDAFRTWVLRSVKYKQQRRG